MKTLLQRLNPKKVGGIVLIIIVLLVVNRILQNRNMEEEALPAEKAKVVSVVSFGEWSPNARREITGTLSSGSDVEIRAKVSGTIDETRVVIGDAVKTGQVLATFQRRNDATQISYENLVQQLAVARIQAASSVQSAEMALATATRSLNQTRSSEEQNYSKTFDLLETRARNAESTFRSALDWADDKLVVSDRAKASVDYSAKQIGSNNSLLRQKTKNLIQALLRERYLLEYERVEDNLSDEEILRLAKDRLTLLRSTQTIIRNLETLVRGTPVTSSFSSTSKSTYEAESTTNITALESAFLSLETQIESAKSEQGRNQLSVIGVENIVQNAESNLALTQAQSQSQVTQLETQLRLASSSRSNLVVRAPFDGNISSKSVLPYDQVSAGAVLFSIVGNNVKPKLQATITRDELVRVQANPNNVKAKLEDGTIIELPEFQIGGTLNSMTQKLKIDFPIEDLPENTLVGSFVKILLPIDGAISNLLPISAISFEPGGAEVLILKDGVGKRVQVEAGKLVSNAIEILSGLEQSTQVVQYRSQAHAGENLEIKIK